jgi:hypothetical protein
LSAVLFAVGAASAQVELAGTDWSGNASVKVKIKPRGEKARSQAETTGYTLYIGPHAEQGLAANQFRAKLHDSTGEMELDGTYVFSGGRLTLTPDGPAIASELQDQLVEACPLQFDPATCSIIDSVTFNVTSAAFKQRVRSSKAGVTSIRSSAKLALEAFYQGERILGLKLRFKSGSGGLQ